MLGHRFASPTKFTVIFWFSFLNLVLLWHFNFAYLTSTLYIVAITCVIVLTTLWIICFLKHFLQISEPETVKLELL